LDLAREKNNANSKAREAMGVLTFKPFSGQEPAEPTRLLVAKHDRIADVRQRFFETLSDDELEAMRERVSSITGSPLESLAAANVALYYGGKRLSDANNLFEAGVKDVSTIQYAACVDPRLKEKEEQDDAEAEARARKLAFHRKILSVLNIKDIVDVYNSTHGAWFEAQITALVSRGKDESPLLTVRACPQIWRASPRIAVVLSIVFLRSNLSLLSSRYFPSRMWCLPTFLSSFFCGFLLSFFGGVFDPTIFYISKR
jgi:hypothetical protein